MVAVSTEEANLVMDGAVDLCTNALETSGTVQHIAAKNANTKESRTDLIDVVIIVNANYVYCIRSMNIIFSIMSRLDELFRSAVD